MPHSTEAIQRSLADRLHAMHGEPMLERTLRNLAVDLVGATDPLDLPADCRVWLDDVIDEAVQRAVRVSLDTMLPQLAASLADAPDDLVGCSVMEAVARARSIHVTEVR